METKGLITVGDALKAINSVKKYLPKDQKEVYLVMPKKLFRKIKKHARTN